MNRSNEAWRTMLICLVLGGLTLAAFWPVTRNDYVDYDDNDYISANARVQQGLTSENFAWAFTVMDANNWHPLTWISHMVVVDLFGMEPGWHHLANLLLHTANAVLLFLLLSRLTGAEWRSALVAALFALHPLHVESVAWVSERKDVLSGFFFVLTLFAYARYACRPVISNQGSVISNDSAEIHGVFQQDFLGPKGR
jgi:hypothetical protein